MTKKPPSTSILTDEEIRKFMAKREKQTSYPNDLKYKGERKINQWINGLVTENDQQRIEVCFLSNLFFIFHNCLFTLILL